MLPEIPAFLGNQGSAGLTNNVKLDDILSLAIRIALIGLLAAAVRQLCTSFESSIYDAFFPTAHISQTDPAFEWIQSYLAQSPQAQKQIKSFRLKTADLRQSRRDDSNRLKEVQNAVKSFLRHPESTLSLARKNATFVDSVIGQISPINEQSIFLNHKGAYLWITRKSKCYAKVEFLTREEHFEICGLSFQPKGIKQFLIDAHGAFFKKSHKELLIFNLGPQTANWIDPIPRPTRPWLSVILPDEVKEPLLQDVKDFLSDEETEWYCARGIPHRRGYLLQGKPGSGKTSLATAIASQLGLDIYIVNPAAGGMDDNKLNKAFRNCPPGNMILLEDIDCVMPPRIRRAQSGSENGNDGDDDENYGDNNATNSGGTGMVKSTVTLSGLLNAIDGVSSQEDCILFATTNHPERLDSALSRPGRFDVQLSFHDATYEQAKLLFKHFFPYLGNNSNLSKDESTLSEKKVNCVLPGKIESDGQLEELAEQFAHGVFNPNLIIKSCDQPDVDLEKAYQAEEDYKTKIEVQISMAALQGYLLMHKKDPNQAAIQASAWSDSLRMNKQEEEKKNRLLKKAARERK
ncbi:uncharacterized protein L201_002016 [Kwoniella dendrophila CBS 6074]|uniref:AAA+ ATPase domain-containing protein n=1 Tax=Kwoniella dendrophila CBS 6074 TaxID=1295534 RepID=A0AAX4JP12_9TREE